MATYYFESREISTNKSTTLATDIMRHLHLRQYLGKTVVIAENHFSLLRLSRKQWLKLARTLQRQRSSTINADKILRRTFAITHMQHMQFSAKQPLQTPEADVFFVSPKAIPEQLPPNIFTVYITTPISDKELGAILKQLPDKALIVDDTGTIPPEKFRLQPKHKLERTVATHWEKLEDFFVTQNIDIAAIANAEMNYVDIMDDALDTLLSVNHDFLQLASDFQHTLELAQPIRLDDQTRSLYNTLALLAYRVQALTPGSINDFLLRSYHEKETFFLHDILWEFDFDTESLEEAVLRHQDAGRTHLAKAIISSAHRQIL